MDSSGHRIRHSNSNSSDADACRECSSRNISILGNHVIHEDRRSPCRNGRCVPEYLVVPERPNRCIGEQIQIPRAHLRRLEREVEAPFTLFQRRLARLRSVMSSIWRCSSGARRRARGGSRC